MDFRDQIGYDEFSSDMHDFRNYSANKINDRTTMKYPGSVKKIRRRELNDLESFNNRFSELDNDNQYSGHDSPKYSSGSGLLSKLLGDQTSDDKVLVCLLLIVFVMLIIQHVQINNINQQLNLISMRGALGSNPTRNLP